MLKLAQRVSPKNFQQLSGLTVQLRCLSTKAGTSQQEAKPNTIQRMPTYQKALELASDKKFEESLGALKQTMAEVEAQVGENTTFHLFLYQKIASLQILLFDLEGVENSFKKCVEVAEKTRTPMNPKLDQTQNVFMWQNNLLKFYLEHDVDKAIDYSKELLDEMGNILPQQDVTDIKFSQATAYALQGLDIEAAQSTMQECLEMAPQPMKGFILNNLGMIHFHNFCKLSKEINDPKEAGADTIQPIIESFDASVLNLKTSVREFEEFDTRFKDISSEDQERKPEKKDEEQTKVQTSLIKQKLFSDEFFSLEPKGDILPKQIKQYDLKNHMANEKLLQQTFTMPPVILPIQNLGEISFIMQKPRDAFCLLDMSLKMYKLFDSQNLLKYKCMTILGSCLQSQGDNESVQRIHEVIFKQLSDIHCYEKVFAIRNYGFLLAKNDQTRLEGQDQIKKAEEMQKMFPYWSERKMGLFVPTIQAFNDSQFNI